MAAGGGGGAPLHNNESGTGNVCQAPMSARHLGPAKASEMEIEKE